MVVFKLEMVHVDYSEQKNHNSGKCLLCTYVICTVYTCHLETLVFCSYWNKDTHLCMYSPTTIGRSIWQQALLQSKRRYKLNLRKCYTLPSIYHYRFFQLIADEQQQQRIKQFLFKHHAKCLFHYIVLLLYTQIDNVSCRSHYNC